MEREVYTALPRLKKKLNKSIGSEFPVDETLMAQRPKRYDKTAMMACEPVLEKPHVKPVSIIKA